MSHINDILSKMRVAGKLDDAKGKGNAGEDAVLALCIDLQRKYGGLLYQGFKYKYASNKAGKNYTGNIMFIEGTYYEVTDKVGLEDEIDILLVTPYKIFPIEVKSYHAKLKLENEQMLYNGKPVEKNPIFQAEKHARHLYHRLYETIPDGCSNYIVPICCFVDRCTVEDARSKDLREYIPACILNNLVAKVEANNTPLRFKLDLNTIKLQLRNICTGVAREVEEI